MGYSYIDRQFILAGWGSSGAIREDGSTDHFTQSADVFHSGVNVFSEIHGNILSYTQDKPEDGGLEREVAAHNGDSGSGTFIPVGDQLYIVGVTSHGTGAAWGSQHGVIRVGGQLKKWIDANINSLDEKVTAEGCSRSMHVHKMCEDTNFD